MKRKDAARKEGTCPRDAPKDEKCANCRSKKGACLVTTRIAAGNALPSPDEPSTSKPRTTQPATDSDMDIEPPNTRPSRERKAPERIEVENLRSRATGKRRPDSCCSCSEPTTSDESAAPKPKFTGPMDKYLSDKRVEAAVNRAVKSITDNPADLERELRDFAQTGEDWRQKSMTLDQENEAIRKKLDKVTKELETFPVYVENIIVRDIQLVALPKQPDILQLRAEDSKKIVLVLPREGWFFHHRPSLPWDASAVTATGQVTNSHKQRLAVDENYLAASLKVPPPKKKTLRSEGASQRKIVQRQEAGMTLRLRPRPARQ